MLRILAPLALCTLALAQTTPPVPPFEVISIRPHQGPMRTLDEQISGPRIGWEAANLRVLVTFAYKLKGYQIAGSIPLLGLPDQRFTILAKAEGDGQRSLFEFR